MDHPLDSESAAPESEQHTGNPSEVDGGGPKVEPGGSPLRVKRARGPLFRRRQYLIDRKGQLLATAKVSGVVLVLLVLVNLVFSLWNRMETHAIVALNPQLAGEMRDIDLRLALVLATVSFVVLVIVMIRTIVLTHRTAGAAFNLRRCLDRVAAGDFDTRVRMRNKDTLRELQEPFNRMLEALQRTAADDQAQLSNLADKIADLDRAEIAKEIRRLADSKVKLADRT